MEVTRNLKQAKPNELDSHFRGNDGMQVRGNDEVEVTRNLKQAKPNELDSHFRGNDGRAASVAPDKCRNLKSR
ncbi:hypothetical protein, partial [Neisseria meningitidis]|uniref:hypothetical protein n=1 Tax=Neisseria meningitidis TaxID=487 RepID=UPI000B0C00E5